MENYLSIYEIAKELNLKKGEVIYLASDITRLANIARNNNEQFNPKQFLETFTGVIGEKGTLLIPTFNYNLKKKSHFEILRTQPITGILAQYALKTPEFIRTYNALHSFAVWGKHAKDLSEIQNESSFSEESPFGFLFHKKAIMVAVDLDLQSSLTFTHYTEEQEKVNYRKWKKYKARMMGGGFGGCTINIIKIVNLYY
jgi:aminoglycoside 3-N-acetyltransferase